MDSTSGFSVRSWRDPRPEWPILPRQTVEMDQDTQALRLYPVTGNEGRSRTVNDSPEKILAAVDGGPQAEAVARLAANFDEDGLRTTRGPRRFHTGDVPPRDARISFPGRSGPAGDAAGTGRRGAEDRGRRRSSLAVAPEDGPPRRRDPGAGRGP